MPDDTSDQGTLLSSGTDQQAIPEQDQAAQTATGQTQTTQAPSQANGNSVTLSDGRVALVRRGKGRDLLEASRRSGTDVSRAQFEILSILTTINGQPASFDDLMNMDMNDVTDLMAATGSASTGFTNPATSST